MGQDPINQRLKILVEALGMNVRSFSIKLGVSDSTARNYIDRGSKPPADFIASVVNHIESVNPKWLLLGEGEMFTSATEPAPFSQKNLGGNNVGQNAAGGRVTQHIVAKPTSNEQSTTNLITLTVKEHELLQREIELLKGQLTDKERIIQLLERQLSMPPST